MRKIITITSILLIVISFASCENKAKVEAVTVQSDSLQLVVKEKDRIIEETFADIEGIATTLSQISEREKIIITASSGEITQTTKKRIADNIAVIAELLKKNRETIAHLSSSTKKLKEANINIASLDNLVISLQDQIKTKDSELTQMSADLAKLKIEITELQGLNENLSTQKVALENTVATQTTDLNTVYWIMKSEKELRNSGIVDKKGFIGRTLVLNNVANLDNFTKSDLRNLESIPVGKKGVKIVSSHPADSYKLITNEKKIVQELVITDKDAFWKASKILVISYSK